MSWVLPRPAGEEAAAPAADRDRLAGLAVPAILSGYLLLALLVTWRLWAHPASATVAGNPGDSAQFAWFLRYDATAVLHGHLPPLITTAMNAPMGISLMWNTSFLLPGVLLTPVTALAGPQVSLNVLTTAGFAGSAAALFWVLRRHGASRTAAAIGGAVYGFSPALLHAAVGHVNLQFAVLLPLIVDAALRLCTGASRPLRGGVVLGLLVTAQLFTGEELLVDAAITAAVLAALLALARPRMVLGRAGPAAAGLAVAAGVTLLLGGWALRIQLFGPLRQHGSAFLPDFYKNDVLGFVTPSSLELVHTRSSAAFAAGYQGGVPEYLAYLGIPLIAVLVVALCRYWRHLPVLAAGLTWLILELFSLGAHPLVDGHSAQGITLPWAWLANLPVLGAALPTRFSILADGAAAALAAFAFDLTAARLRGGRTAVTPGTSWRHEQMPGARVSHRGPTWGHRRASSPLGSTAAGAGATVPADGSAGGASGARLVGLVVAAIVAIVALLPLVPAPLPVTPAAPLPAGWSAALAALRLPAGARVLVVPVPTALLTAPLRWQADAGNRISLIGGYFQGPASNGHVYIDGNGPRPLAVYVDNLWTGQPAGPPPSAAQVRSDLSYWRPAAVVAAAVPPSLRAYLDQLLGAPTVVVGQMRAWRIPAGDL